ncbi:C39 family peptidase [Natronospora cellulosivora (SeqCode)]
MGNEIFLIGETHILEREADIHVSNNREYDWFFPQGYSKNPDINCGPATIKMAAKWYDEEFSKTIDIIRDEIAIAEGEGITTGHIKNYLKRIKIDYSVLFNPLIDEIIENINKGNIIIGITNLSYIRRNFGRINRNINMTSLAPGFYEANHSIIIKGYKKYKIHDKEFVLLEVYEPGIRRKDSSGAYIGEDIYYFADDILRGMDELSSSIHCICNKPKIPFLVIESNK